MFGTFLRFAVPVLIVALLAGCVEDAGLPTGVDPGPNADVFATLAAGLPCDAPMQDGLTDNLRLVGEHAFSDGADGSAHREIDTHRYGSYTLLAALRLSGGGFDLVNITDPRSPTLVSTWVSVAGGWQDIKFTSDGSAVIHSTGAELEVVDVRDPSQPVLESTYALAANGAHMLASWGLGGREHVSISKAEGADVSIFRLSGEPGARTLERVAHTYMTALRPVHPHLQGTGGNGELARALTFDTRSHDTWFEVDPVSGTPMLWIANSYWGVAALDVSDPAAPALLFEVAHEDGLLGYVHTVQVAHVDGKRYVVAVTEYGIGTLKVWDATDLQAPRLVARWHMDLPTKPNHNLQVVGPYVFVAHFHDGVFVFDLRGVAAADATGVGRLEPIAHAPPQGDVGGPRIPISPGQAYLGPVDVVVQDGLLWVVEEEPGLRAYAFGCITPGDIAASSSG